jgi:hypothetical protein
MPDIDWSKFTSETTASSVKPDIDWNQFTSSEGPSSSIASLPSERTAGLEQINAARSENASNLPSKLGAAVIGAGRGVVDAALDTANFIGDVLSKVGPTKKLGEGIKAVSGPIQYRTSIEQQYPDAAAVGRGAGYLGGMIAGPRKIVDAGLAGLGKIPQVAGSLSKLAPTTIEMGKDVAAGALGGAVMAGEGNRALGATVGAALPIAVQKAMAHVGKFAASTADIDRQANMIIKRANTDPNFVSKDIFSATDEAFDSFRNVSGSVVTQRPQAKISEFVKTYSKKLSPRQVGVLDDLQTSLKDATSIADLHNARKMFTQDFKKVFLIGDDSLTGNARAAITSLKEATENNLKMNAAKLGVLDKYQTANELFKQSLEATKLNTLFNNSVLSGEGHNLRTFVKQVKKAELKDPRQFSPATKLVLKGFYKSMAEADKLLGLKTAGTGIVADVMSIMTGMINSPVGRAVLIKTGANTPQGRELLKNITQGIVNRVQGDVIKEPSSMNSEGTENGY